MRILGSTLAVALFTSTSLAADPPARAAVEKLLDQMSAAALAGDRNTFMACLDTSNAFFKQEQTAWCDDIVKHHPKSVAFTIEDEPAPSFGDKETHATISIKYQSDLGAAAGDNEIGRASC